MVRDLINLKNETDSLEDREYSKESGKMWKMRHTHFRTGNIARNTKNVKYEKCTL
jgi:predicted double-glycine peptidase